MLAIARRINSSQDLVISHYHVGTSCVLLSEVAAARQHFRQAIECYHEEDFRGVPENHWYAFDTFAMAATTEWMLGFPEQALRYMVAARTNTPRLNNPYILAVSYSAKAIRHADRRDCARALSTAQEAERLSRSWVPRNLGHKPKSMALGREPRWGRFSVRLTQ